MDLIAINDDKFPARTSEDFMKLMDAAINGGASGVVKWALAGSPLPWKWRFNELSILKQAKNNSKNDASLVELTYHS
jgi:hypothetical protein